MSNKRQHKKSYRERMKGKQKDFLKRAYTGNEFKLEKTYRANKKKLKYIISKREFDRKLDSFIYYIDCYDANTDEYLTTYYQLYEVHANTPEVGAVFYENICDREYVERNEKATRKYKKLLDEAHRSSKHDRCEEKRKYKRVHNYVIE